MGRQPSRDLSREYQRVAQSSKEAETPNPRHLLIPGHGASRFRRDLPGTRLAKGRVMPKKSTHSAPFALAIDGGVLLNAGAQLDPTLVSRLAQALGVSPDQLFIGTRLPAVERERTLARLD